MRTLQATFRPIHRWPQTETRSRTRSRFRAGWSTTLEQLQRELDFLDARAVVIQLDLREEDIRLDGWPQANARPSSPRVILSFETPAGAYSYPCDTWDTWQDNLRAIALTLENLRAIERYGVTKHAEQYAGWKALPGTGGTTTTLTEKGAAERLLALAGSQNGNAADVLWDPEFADRLYRIAAKRHHPDLGGSAEAFILLQEAKRVVDAAHGRRP